MKISVIVPVYNSEKYLKKCISSVLRQTYSDWELILIDDGSIDSSPEIVDRAARKDNRVRAIHQKNAGPGIARNRGMEEATGDYAVFLDSDDFIAKDYFKLLAPKAEKNDLVFIDVLQISPDGKVLAKEKMSDYKGWSKDRTLRSQMTGKIPWGGVRKTVNLDLLRKNHIQFTSHRVGEEALFSFQALYSAKSFDFIDEKPVYFYVNHENSQSKLKTSDPWGGTVDAIREYLKRAGLYKKYADTVNAFNVAATVVSLDRIEQMYKGEQKKEKAHERVEQFQRTFDTNAGIDKANMSNKAKVFVPFLRAGIYEPVLWASRVRSLKK